MLTAKEIMTKTVLTAKTDTPFNEVVNVFTKSNINHLPITNANGSIRGIISSTDVLKAIHEMDQFAINYNGFSIERRLDVKDEMTSEVISVSDKTNIREIVNLMVENNFQALPVIKDDSIVGIITSNDILKAIYKNELVL